MLFQSTCSQPSVPQSQEIWCTLLASESTKQTHGAQKHTWTKHSNTWVNDEIKEVVSNGHMEKFSKTCPANFYLASCGNISSWVWGRKPCVKADNLIYCPNIWVRATPYGPFLRRMVFPSSVPGFMEEGFRDRKTEEWRETHIWGPLSLFVQWTQGAKNIDSITHHCVQIVSDFVLTPYLGLCRKPHIGVTSAAVQPQWLRTFQSRGCVD